MLGRLVHARHHVERVEIARRLPVALKDARGYRPLQSGEVKGVVMVVPQRELYKPVAEPADAVVQQNGLCRWRHDSNDTSYRDAALFTGRGTESRAGPAGTPVAPSIIVKPV